MTTFETLNKVAAYNDALEMMRMADETGGFLEPTSAFKQAASDRGLPCGEEMGKFVNWANMIYVA